MLTLPRCCCCVLLLLFIRPPPLVFCCCFFVVLFLSRSLLSFGEHLVDYEQNVKFANANIVAENLEQNPPKYLCPILQRVRLSTEESVNGILSCSCLQQTLLGGCLLQLCVCMCVCVCVCADERPRKAGCCAYSFKPGGRRRSCSYRSVVRVCVCVCVCERASE